MLNKLNILRKALDNKEKINSTMSNMEGKSYVKDVTYWNAPYDVAKKQGSATIAFLPFADMFTDPDGITAPYIFLPEHGELKGTKGKKYFGILCPKELGKPCPICDKFFEFWNGTEEEKETAKALSLGRKRYYYGNIIVIKNQANPDDVGKVFKYKFGVTIKDKINKKVNPVDADDEAIIVYDPINILPFKINSKEKGGYRNFDDSEWIAGQKHLADFFTKLDNIEEKNKWLEDNVIDKLYSTKDFVTPESYRSEEELEKIVNDVLLNSNLINDVPTTYKPPQQNKSLGNEISKPKESEQFDGDEGDENSSDKINDEFDDIFKE